MSAPAFDFKPTPKQARAIKSIATEILYGGAAGGGKSYFMRALAILLCMLVPGLNVYLFRRLYDDLIKNHMEGIGGFPEMLAPLVQGGFVKIVEAEIRFWNGSRIFLCHCQHEKDRFKYQGAEIHVLLIDELTMFSEVIYRFLRGRLRAPGLVVPQWARDFFREKFGVELAEKIPMALAGSNPGNVGHAWVKAAFIDDAQPFEVRRMSKAEGGMLRQFIPARLEDNNHVNADEYSGKLEGLGSKELVRAMLYGDWGIIAGAFFDILSEDKHKLPTFTPPKDWTRCRSFDWGSKRPFSVGWWVIVDEATWLSDLCPSAAARGYRDRLIPKGALIRYREWYGVKKDENGKSIANEGLRLDNRAIGQGIKAREAGEKIDESLSVADPAIWAENGGPSIAEQMAKCDPKNPSEFVGPRFKPADNTRIDRQTQLGWVHMYARLGWMDTEDEQPMLYVMDNCSDWWRTVPALQHDEKRPEDINSEMEDHAADDSRYMCAARPISRVPKPRAASGPKPFTLEWIMQQR